MKKLFFSIISALTLICFSACENTGENSQIEAYKLIGRWRLVNVYDRVEKLNTSHDDWDWQFETDHTLLTIVHDQIMDHVTATWSLEDDVLKIEYPKSSSEYTYKITKLTSTTLELQDEFSIETYERIK